VKAGKQLEALAAELAAANISDASDLSVEEDGKAVLVCYTVSGEGSTERVSVVIGARGGVKRTYE